MSFQTGLFSSPLFSPLKERAALPRRLLNWITSGRALYYLQSKRHHKYQSTHTCVTFYLSPRRGISTARRRGTAHSATASGRAKGAGRVGGGTPRCHPNGTLVPPRRCPSGILRPPQCHPDATFRIPQMPPRGCPKSSPVPPCCHHPTTWPAVGSSEQGGPTRALQLAPAPPLCYLGDVLATFFIINLIFDL